MRVWRIQAWAVLVLMAGLIALTAAHGAETAAETAADAPAKADSKVFILPLNGPIDKSLMIVFRRAFREIEAAKPDAVVIDIDTPGGGLLETEEIIAWMRSLDVPIYAFVNTHAQSAGAIISLGTDAVYMAPGSRIGSAMPILIMPGGGVAELPDDVQEKILSDTRALVRGLAQENGYWQDVAMAMVDRDYEVKVGERVISKPGELLNLTAEEAIEVIPPRTEPILAKGIVKDVPALLEQVGLANAQTTRFEEQPAETLARYIVMVGPLLFSLALLAIFIEIRTPGFGIPGIIGICLLMIYFFGHYVAGLAGMEELALVVAGFVLLAIEVFVIPGFGITGILGITLILAGTVMAMVPHLPQVPQLPDMEPITFISYLEEALWRLLIMLVVSGIGLFLISKLLPRTSFYRRLILETALDHDSGYVSAETRYRDYIGRVGVAVTPLRPAGIAMLGDDRVDVVSNGDLVSKGAKVRVTEVQGRRVVVEAVSEDAD